MKNVNQGQKSSKIKNNIFGNDDSLEENGNKNEYNFSKLNDILENLTNIFEDQNLKELGNLKDNKDISVLANVLYNEMEILLSTHKKF